MSDSDFMENIEKLVYIEDLDQKYKGQNIEQTGKLQALSKERQDFLKQQDYPSGDEEE